MAPVPVHLKLALSVGEAAAMIGLSQSSIRRLVADGHLRTVPFTDRVLIARAELERYVTSTMTAVAS